MWSCFRFVCSAAYYGLSLNSSNLGGNDYVNFAISGAIEVPAYIFCQLTLDRVGRRPTLIASMLIGGAALLLSPAVQNHSGNAKHPCLVLLTPCQYNWTELQFKGVFQQPTCKMGCAYDVAISISTKLSQYSLAISHFDPNA